MKTAPIKYDPGLFDRLTAREQAFVMHPLAMTNPRQAAVEVGYSESWARSHAATKRRQLLYFILPENHKRMAASGVTLDRIVQELSCMAFANEADFYQRVEHEDDKGGVREFLTGIDLTLLPEHMARAIAQVTTENIVLPNGELFQSVGYVLHSKKDALKILAEMLGGFDPRTRDPRTREPGDAEARRKQAELFDFMTSDEIEQVSKIYARAKERQQKAAVDADIIEEEK